MEQVTTDLMLMMKWIYNLASIHLTSASSLFCFLDVSIVINLLLKV